MASATVTELKKKSEAASANLHRQLEGMEPYLERSDAPGEWTTMAACGITPEAERRRKPGARGKEWGCGG